MSKLQTHTIVTTGYPNLLDWVKNHKYRDYFDCGTEWVLACTKKIVMVKDQASRELMMEMLGTIERLQERGVEMHKEMDTLFDALTKIDAQTDEELAAAKKRA